MSDDVKERVARAIADALGPDSFDCTRVWSAWSYGTMGPDDFIETHQRADEIADAVFAAIRPGDEINGCVLRPRTIYDRRGEIDTALWNAAPELFAALRDLLSAVEERCGLHQSIESATIARAHNAINIAAVKEPPQCPES